MQATSAAQSPRQTRTRNSCCLSLREFGIAYGEKVVLSSVDLEIPSLGIVTILGPTATGKSTLLRTLAGITLKIPSVRTWGDCTYVGEPLRDDNRPVLISQNSRLLTATLLDNLLVQAEERFAATLAQKRDRAVESLEQIGLSEFRDQLDRPVVELPLVVQRLVAIARLLPADPDLLLIDEPTTNLDDDDAERVLEAIREQQGRRAVVVVLHNQRHARSLVGETALLAGGVIQEIQATEDFFEAPLTAAGREFRDTGSCSDPSPGADAESIATGIRPRLKPPPDDVEISSEVLGPRGFAWLLPGKLAGTPRPGVVADIDYDLAALRRVGVTKLISLTTRPVDLEPLERHGIKAYWYPIADMAAPSLELAEDICRHIDRLLERKDTVAVHCRAGLGRTGTILCAYLIWCGHSAITALETARYIEPKWVQSEAQIRFLEAFGDRMSGAGVNAADACSASESAGAGAL